MKLVFYCNNTEPERKGLLYLLDSNWMEYFPRTLKYDYKYNIKKVFCEKYSNEHYLHIKVGLSSTFELYKWNLNSDALKTA